MVLDSTCFNAVVNRVYGGDRSAELLPPGCLFNLSCRIVGRSRVEAKRGDVAPYIVYHLEIARLPQGASRGGVAKQSSSKASGRKRGKRGELSWVIYRRFREFLALRTSLNRELVSVGYLW